MMHLLALGIGWAVLVMVGVCVNEAAAVPVWLSIVLTVPFAYLLGRGIITVWKDSRGE